MPWGCCGGMNTQRTCSLPVFPAFFLRRVFGAVLFDSLNDTVQIIEKSLQIVVVKGRGAADSPLLSGKELYLHEIVRVKNVGRLRPFDYHVRYVCLRGDVRHLKPSSPVRQTVMWRAFRLKFPAFSARGACARE